MTEKRNETIWESLKKFEESRDMLAEIDDKIATLESAKRGYMQDITDAQAALGRLGITERLAAALNYGAPEPKAPAVQPKAAAKRCQRGTKQPAVLAALRKLGVARTPDITEALGLEPTRSENTRTSAALSALRDKGAVESIRDTESPSGRGNIWSVVS